MTFNDDLANDLANVFYDDFKHEAVIAGQTVKGHLSITDSGFGVDGKTTIFDGPASSLASVRRGDQITINGELYTVVRPDYYGQRTMLTVDEG